MQFTFIRHGETSMNQAGILQGRLDSPLTPKGIEQAKVAACKLQNRPFDSIAHSPLLRSKMTAQIIAQTLKLPLVEYPELTERDYGPWQGISYRDIRSQYRSIFFDMIKWNLNDHFSRSPLPGIESYEVIFQRILSLLNRLEQRTLFVTHAGVLSALLLQSQYPGSSVPIFHSTGSITLTKSLEIVECQGLLSIEDVKKCIPLAPNDPFVIF